MDKMTFSSVLMEARKKSGMSEREAASLIGVSNSTWARWEKGEACPNNIETLDKISDLLDLSFFHLITLVCPSVKEEHQTEFEILDDLWEMNEEDKKAVHKVTRAMAFCSEVTWH
ncbi:MAG: helix-turn-helix transcriptional regulator [Clostridia bacterium]|nr:helix-turn-helix transcriptional regulator [Clostridia bacterium]